MLASLQDEEPMVHHSVDERLLSLLQCGSTKCLLSRRGWALSKRQERKASFPL